MEKERFSCFSVEFTSSAGQGAQTNSKDCRGSSCHCCTFCFTNQPAMSMRMSTQRGSGAPVSQGLAQYTTMLSAPIVPGLLIAGVDRVVAQPWSARNHTGGTG